MSGHARFWAGLFWTSGCSEPNEPDPAATDTGPAECGVPAIRAVYLDPTVGYRDGLFTRVVDHAVLWGYDPGPTDALGIWLELERVAGESVGLDVAVGLLDDSEWYTVHSGVYVSPADGADPCGVRRIGGPDLEQRLSSFFFEQIPFGAPVFVEVKINTVYGDIGEARFEAVMRKGDPPDGYEPPP